MGTDLALGRLQLVHHRPTNQEGGMFLYELRKSMGHGVTC